MPKWLHIDGDFPWLYRAFAAIFPRRYFNYSTNRVARFHKLRLVKQTEVVCTPTHAYTNTYTLETPVERISHSCARSFGKLNRIICMVLRNRRFKIITRRPRGSRIFWDSIAPRDSSVKLTASRKSLFLVSFVSIRDSWTTDQNLGQKLERV